MFSDSYVTKYYVLSNIINAISIFKLACVKDKIMKLYNLSYIIISFVSYLYCIIRRIILKYRCIWWLIFWYQTWLSFLWYFLFFLQVLLLTVRFAILICGCLFLSLWSAILHQIIIQVVWLLKPVRNLDNKNVKYIQKTISVFGL